LDHGFCPLSSARVQGARRAAGDRPATPAGYLAPAGAPRKPKTGQRVFIHRARQEIRGNRSWVMVKTAAAAPGIEKSFEAHIAAPLLATHCGVAGRLRAITELLGQPASAPPSYTAVASSACWGPEPKHHPEQTQEELIRSPGDVERHSDYCLSGLGSGRAVGYLPASYPDGRCLPWLACAVRPRRATRTVPTANGSWFSKSSCFARGHQGTSPEGWPAPAMRFPVLDELGPEEQIESSSQGRWRLRADYLEQFRRLPFLQRPVDHRAKERSAR